jgi:predicted GNAT family acetyltransferase
MSRFLVKRILEKGKTPRLISGYDEVAELYRQVGFETRGRWGELYL